MKKMFFLAIALVTVMTLGSLGGYAYAEDDIRPIYGAGYSSRLYLSGQSPEELLKTKIEFIDQMVKDGKITSERAEELKNIITERMSSCDGLGSNREDNERLGIGFGRLGGTGQGRGRGTRNGIQRGLCILPSGM